MEPQLITVEQQNQIALVTFNRPEKRNALSTPVLYQLKAALHEIEGEAGFRVVILMEAGSKAFIAGADIGEYVAPSFLQFVDYQFYSRKLFTYLDQFPKPVIGAFNGYALGGDFEIALCCDLLMASTNAQFGLPEGLLGLCPGGGGTQKLARALGRYVAVDVLLTAPLVSDRRPDAGTGGRGGRTRAADGRRDPQGAAGAARGTACRSRDEAADLPGARRASGGRAVAGAGGVVPTIPQPGCVGGHPGLQ